MATPLFDGAPLKQNRSFLRGCEYREPSRRKWLPFGIRPVCLHLSLSCFDSRPSARQASFPGTLNSCYLSCVATHGLELPNSNWCLQYNDEQRSTVVGAGHSLLCPETCSGGAQPTSCDNGMYWPAIQPWCGLPGN